MEIWGLYKYPHVEYDEGTKINHQYYGTQAGREEFPVGNIVSSAGAA